MDFLDILRSTYIAITDRDGGWHETHNWKMRRKARDGTWQYRDMTDAEAESYKDDYEARQY